MGFEVFIADDDFCLCPFSSPEPTILLACGRNRELWEQPFQAGAIDADYVKLDGQNLDISLVISKWWLPELSIPAPGQKDRRLWGRERLVSCHAFVHCQIPVTVLVTYITHITQVTLKEMQKT